MESWLIYVIIAFFLWGIGGIISKLATSGMSAKGVFAYHIVGVMLAGLIGFLFFDLRLESGNQGMYLGILLGFFTIIGELFYLMAVSKGNVSVVTTISALYPLVTIILAATFLKEIITLKQGIGMIFAVLSIILLAS